MKLYYVTTNGKFAAMRVGATETGIHQLTTREQKIYTDELKIWTADTAASMVQLRARWSYGGAPISQSCTLVADETLDGSKLYARLAGASPEVLRKLAEVALLHDLGFALGVLVAAGGFSTTITDDAKHLFHFVPGKKVAGVKLEAVKQDDGTVEMFAVKAQRIIRRR